MITMAQDNVMDKVAEPQRPPVVHQEALYDVRETVLISEWKGSAWYQRIAFTGKGSDSSAKVIWRMDLGPLAGIIDVRVVTDATGRQSVAVLKELDIFFISGMDHIESHGTGAVAMPGSRIVGFDLSPEQKLVVLIPLGPDCLIATSLTSWEGDREYPQIQEWRNLRSGSIVSADFLISGVSRMLVTTRVVEGHSSAELEILSVREGRADGFQVINLGTVMTTMAQRDGNEAWNQVYHGLASCFEGHIADHNQVAVEVTRMRVGSADQQLAVTWFDAKGVHRLALVGWTEAGKAEILETAVVAPPLGKQIYPICRLAASDLQHKGVNQLVVATRSNRGVELQLYAVQEDAARKVSAKCVSQYFTEHSNYIVDYWFQLSAGIFGTCAGVVQVVETEDIGFHHDTHERVLEAHLVSGFVPVDPGRGFLSDSEGAKPGVIYRSKAGPRAADVSEATPEPNEWWPESDFSLTRMRLDAKRPSRIYVLPVDLTGESVLLGQPTYTRAQASAQILGIFQAHPYDRRVALINPSVSFNSSSSKAEGMSISHESSWSFSNDLSQNIGLGSFSLSDAVHHSFTRGGGTSNDDTTTYSVALHASFGGADKMLISYIDYHVWRYPVIRGCATHPTGNELLVVIPERSTLTTALVDADDYAYHPKCEVGKLLSYLDIEKDGYDPDNVLFPRGGYEVTARQDTEGMQHDIQISGTKTITTHTNLVDSESVHAGFNPSTMLFDVLPANFGINVSSSKSYSQGKMEASHVNLHSGLSLAVNSGSVKDDQYKYLVTPIIYKHSKLGCLMLAWDVSLSQAGWRSREMQAPQPSMIRRYPDSSSDVYNTFTRSIVVKKNSDGTMSVEAEIFNNGLTNARHVSCEFFDISEDFGPQWPTATKSFTEPKRSLGKGTLDLLGPLGRETICLPGSIKAKEGPYYIAVHLHMGTIDCNVYWGVYPPNTLFQAAGVGA